MTDFDAMFRRAVGDEPGVFEPYGFQRRLAYEGLPELLRVPTGGGKTLAVVLAWLFRRRFHADAEVRTSTPGRLVMVLPMRTLVNQTHEEARGWLKQLGLLVEGDAALDPEADGVGLHLLMGGESDSGGAWRLCPHRDAMLVGTQDMLLSRALNRGYGASRYVWPVDFGLLNSGTHWVFDEVQLMGPALPTSRQLAALRHKFGMARGCSSTWMSATVEPEWLATVDNPEVASTVELDEEDRTGDLLVRLQARKTVRRAAVERTAGYEKRIAVLLAEAHRPGTLTLAIMNSVERAQRLHRELQKITSVKPVLLHARFRPPERQERYEDARVAEENGGFVVSTQVLEAGVDISARTLFTEAAPWPSIVQRAGRCNRDGRVDGEAVLWWARPPRSGPYEPEAVAASVEVLTGLEGQQVTPESLAAAGTQPKRALHPVLRRRDVMDLFDTAPDLDGNDVDVSRFIRADADVDVYVAWRKVSAGQAVQATRQPGRDERCPVPVSEVKRALAGGHLSRAWWFDYVENEWVRCLPADVRPGRVLIAEAVSGCYDAHVGWDSSIRTPVPPVDGAAASVPVNGDAAQGADPLSATGEWIRLEDHLVEVRTEVEQISAELNTDGGLDLAEDHLAAAALAGLWHDAGKAHPEFQQRLLSTAADSAERERLAASGPWAKSRQQTGGHGERRWFRHELASALALLGDPSVLPEHAEQNLVAYLVAAHHGRVRLGIRAMPGEKPPDEEPERLVALGVHDGEAFPDVQVTGLTLRPGRLNLGVMAPTSAEASWSARMLALRDHPDLGPFRLGFLEALVRVADWRVSARGNHE